ncbi:sulfatase family protein [Mariniblastus fucicola]|uniref:Arylsulfatase n=1 Tax=Mariniblastus fucicola TaxID=980251 RepID=A0A5B9PBN0_9BACT|nr:arylsulfatase [Mariniblastus fucicola]QEG24107.1 Arylsulfatase [Mariniblastus fucicola]
MRNLFQTLSLPFILCAFSGLLSVSNSQACCFDNEAGKSQKHPNIVMILADDLGYGDVGCYNSESRIPTPNLDRLATQGMRFVDAHSPCTVCTPTRYSLMTGQMAFRVPNGGRVFSGAGGPSLIAPNRLTLPQMLKSEGYTTACFGKWHIGLTFFDNEGQAIHNGGFDGVKRIDFSRDIAGGPIDCGFDHFFGTACCPTTDWLYAYIDGKRIPNPPTGKLDKSKLPKHPYANDNRPGLRAEDFDLEEVDMKFLEKSQSFLKDHVRDQPDSPFFLFHSTQAVHLPSFPGNKFKGKTNSGPHGDFIFELDHVVGELMQTLEDLEIADETLVIFTSDNGPEVPTIFHMRKDHQHDGAKPWRGVKRDNWEGGHRVPLIVRWPGKVASGSTCSQITSLTDVMATVAEIVEFDLPSDAAEDSFSMLPALTEQEQSPIRPYLLQQGFGGKKYLAIRRGKWKYLAHKGSGGNNYSTHAMLKQYQLADTAPDARGQLFDLETDPGETHNLASQHPAIASELENLLRESVANGRSVTRD